MSQQARIVATLTSAPEPALLAGLTAADLLEVRADLIGDPDLDRLRSLFPGELLYTLRSAAEGGGFEGSGEERERRLAAASGYDLVDLESGRDLTPGTLSAVEPKRRIVSWHGAAESTGQLVARAGEMRSTEARLWKLVPRASNASEAVAALTALHRLATDDVMLFASGAAGTWTRLLAPRLGAPVVYAATGGMPGAPGQLSLGRLIEDYGLPSQPPIDRLFGVVGAPVAESLSPRLHNGLYRRLGVEALYLPFHVESFGAFWLDVVESGALEALGLPLAGLSVTTPHKEVAHAVAGASSPIATRIGAANTLVQRRGVWEAEASDPEGVSLPLAARKVSVAGKTAAVLGVGGAGRAAAVALELAGARVSLVNRTRERGLHEASRLGMPFVPRESFAAETFGLLVNATPLGRRSGDEMPFDIDSLSPETLVVDMVYRHDEATALVRAARDRGLVVVDGREVLLCQAGRQFHMMTGLDFPTDEARQILALDSA